MKSNRLGRGLDALIPQMTPEEQASRGDSLSQLPVTDIRTNPNQPRFEFDRKKLDELKSSIQENGLIQPVTVHKVDGGYELVSGERRFRAVQELGITKIPAYVMEVESQEKLLELALIENVQRDDLNAIEVAKAYNRLHKEYGLTQDAVAQKVGKDRATVANFIRLLRLPEAIQQSLQKDEITMGHARALMGLSGQGDQIRIWKQTQKQGLSVRDVERAVQKISDEKNVNISRKSATKDPAFTVIEDRLRSVIGSRVQIRKLGKGGKIEIAYFSNEDLDRIIELLETIQD